MDDAPPLVDRDLDIVYRGRELPFHLGSFAQTKKTIGEKMKPFAEQHNLKFDISSKEKRSKIWLRLEVISSKQQGGFRH